MNHSRTSIIILSSEADKQILQEVLTGIEEEGVLYEHIIINVKADIRILSKEASEQSKLGAGIGIRGVDTAICFNTPVGYHYPEFGNMKPRRLAQNAARYVKSKPFIL